MSCTETDTISKQTKARFHMTHVITEFHWVHQNWFPSIWYVPCKPCTYLASRLALSPNRPNRASTWAYSPRSTNKCVQNGFLDYAALGANCAPILHRNLKCLKMDRSEIPYDTCHQGVPSVASKLISKHMVCSMQTMHLPCIRIRLSPNWSNQASTWAFSPRSTK